MTRIVYKKIVRDKIPEIIAKQGKICEVRMLPAGEQLIWWKSSGQSLG